MGWHWPVTRAACIPPLTALPEKESISPPASAAFIPCLPLRAASGSAGSAKHHWLAAPSSALLCLCSLKWEIFYWRPLWTGSATINYSKKLPPGPGWEGRGLRVKQVTLKRIERKRGLGASLFPQPVTLTAMHPLIWEEVWRDGRWELRLWEMLWGALAGL